MGGEGEGSWWWVGLWVRHEQVVVFCRVRRQYCLWCHGMLKEKK